MKLKNEENNENKFNEEDKISRRISKEDTKPEDIRELTIKNLDTGEQFIIGENDPDFEFDTFPLSSSNRNNSESNNNNNNNNKTWYKSFIDWLFGRNEDRSQQQQQSLQSSQQSNQNQYQYQNQSNIPISSQDPAHFSKLSSFKFRKELGRGAFGRVLLAESKINGELYALKIISKKNMRLIDKKQALAERDILHAMTHNSPHPFTTGLKFAFQSENNLYIGMEYFCGGNLKQLIQNFGTLPDEWVKIYAAELILAVSHLHSMQVLYRDIKPHNVMIDREGHIILIDYGLSKQEVNNPTGAMSLVGTPDYSAPEVLRTAVFRLENEERKRNGKAPKTPQVEKGEYGYGMAADWWSIGVMIYEMLCGYPTFRGSDLKQTYQKVLYGEVEFRDEKYFSPCAREIILGLLQRDPQERLGSASNSPEDIQKCAFFDNINWNDIYNRIQPGPWIPPQEQNKKSPKKDVESQIPIINQTLSDIEDDIPGFSGQNCSETTSEVSDTLSVRDSIIATGENRNDPNRLPRWSYMDENALKMIKPPSTQFK